MMTFICVEKIRNKQGRIIHYILKDEQGKFTKVKTADLKLAIARGAVHVVNLKLTSDGKLIDTNNKDKTKPKPKRSYYDIIDIINRTLLNSDLIHDAVDNKSKINIHTYIIKDYHTYNTWQTMLEEDYPPLDILNCGIDTSEACEYDVKSDWYKEYTSKFSIETLKNQIISCRLCYKEFRLDWYLVLTSNNTWEFQMVVVDMNENKYLDESYVYSLIDTIEGSDPFKVAEIISNKNFSIDDITY